MADVKHTLGPKWACDYCTYENWPASKKCTLCRAQRQLQYINEEAPVPEQDIYKMAPLISGSNNCSPPHIGCSQPIINYALDPKNKWACQACTYLNWPKAVRCTQCYTPRPKAVPVINPSTTQPLSININIAETTTINSPGTIANTSPASRKNSPKTSPNSPEAAKALNNDINRAVVTNKSTIKWICKACTYENWPKTVKCVLCNVPKGKTYADVAKSTASTLVSASLTSSPSSPAALSSVAGRTVTTSRSGSPSDNETPSALNSPSSRPGSSRHKKRIPSSAPHSPASRSIENMEVIGATASPTLNQDYQDKQVNNQPGSSTTRGDDNKSRSLRGRNRDLDWLWLNACQGVVEGDSHAVEAFLTAGGDPARALNAEECTRLGRPRVFERNYTLVHLAIRFQREDMLAVLLTATDVVAKAKKRVPSHVAPDVATDIIREISINIRQKKGDFPCSFLMEISTFALPADIEDLPNPIKKQLFDEIIDRGVQKELEDEEPVINWSVEITDRLGSRLYALWNRTAGDCLLDSVLQATWGVMDRDNTLRRALADSLCDGANMFYPRWKYTEAMQAQSLHFTLDESQWQQDWAILLSLASQPGSSLEQIHIFALSHILRRPIIVYGIKFVKSFRGENLGLARFQGVYLPLLWEQSFCWKSPIALGYTRGHFSALVAMEADTCDVGAGAHLDNNDNAQITYLPLMDYEGKLLPIHFLSPSEHGHEEGILKDWLDVCVTSGGLCVAQQRLTRPPILVRQMVDEWLDRYRRLAQVLQSTTATRPHLPAHNAVLPTTAAPTQALSSDDETDDE